MPNTNKALNLTDHNIKINIYNGLAYSIALNLVNPYFAKFAERIGASDYHIALLNSLPALVAVFAYLPGAIFIESSKNKIKATSSVLFAQKLFYLLLITIPFMNKVYQPLLFVLFVGLMNFPGSIAIMGYQSSIGDIFKPQNRSRAMGLRNRYVDFARLVVTFAAGQVLTILPKTPADTIRLYQLFFVIAFIFGVIEAFTMRKFRGVRDNNNGSGREYLKSFIHTLKNIYKQKNFLSFLGCSLLFHFGWQMGWPLFNIYIIKILGANERWLATLSIASGISSIISATLWAKYADKKGNSLALAMATFGISFTPFMFALAPSLKLLIFFNILMGISVAGTILILFNLLLEVVPDKNRTVYLALYNVIINISATIAPIFSVWFKNRTSLAIAFILVGSLRFIGSFSFFIRKRILDKKATVK